MTQNRRQIMEEIEQQLNNGDIEFGEAIKTLRKDITGLRQQEFAKLCGVSLRTLAQIESGRGNPTIKTLNQLLRLFGMKVGITMARK